MVTHWMQIAVRLRNGLRENSIKIMVSFRVIEPKSIRLGVDPIRHREVASNA